MRDSEIIDLFWNRDQNALMETSSKYGSYLRKVSMNILGNAEDAEECINDTLFSAWNAIPPRRPEMLSTFLGKIARNLSINRYHAAHAQKRGCGEYALSLDELDECVAGSSGVEAKVEESILEHSINEFLRGEKVLYRGVFIKRYFYSESIAGIADELGMSESRIKSILFRTRNRLKKHLEREGLM